MSVIPEPPFATRHRGADAFTLLELLVVIAIMAIMAAVLLPALTGIKGAGDVTKSAYDIAGILDQARAYAMANNTYVWVGIFEEDPAAPATTPATAGTGRIVVAAVASRDGTRGYEVTSLSSPATWANYSNGANLVPIARLQRFENLHLAPLFSTLPNKGGMSRPTVNSGNYQLGNTNCASITPFDWPLGKATGTGQYSFTKVINFDPQGVARIQMVTNEDNIEPYMDIGLIPTHGNAVPATTPANVAAIQVNGMTGATRIYRP